MLEWHEAMTIDHGGTDDDHHRLHDLIRRFLALPADEDQRPRAAALLERLRDLAFRHFESEERFQAAIRYPGLAEHRLQHRRMIELLGDIIAQVEARESAFAFAYAKEKADTLLPFWLMDHFVKADLPLKRYLARTPSVMKALAR